MTRIARTTRKPATKKVPLPKWLRIVREDPASYEKEAWQAGGITMTSPADIYRLVKPRLAREEVELSLVVLLDTSNHVLGVQEVNRGTMDQSMAFPRDVFRIAIAYGAFGIVLVHNHPSGNHTPSRGDITTTDALTKAGELLGIVVYDHLVVDGKGFTSMAQQGLMSIQAPSALPSDASAALAELARMFAGRVREQPEEHEEQEEQEVHG